ncbi:LysR family transcriptional regulator [Lachnospiraceae bacterium OttesenSCG-928-E19]|nr:LysR family transcriptional regulator [Lachnospiraceae bacterium OttesenSCG-928-E19]
MNIEQLQSFLTLSQTLNYTEAAENLYITQPTLTRHIKHLEMELGCRLFDRNTKQVSLSAKGESFLKYATNILVEYNRGLAHITGEAVQNTDTLNFGFLRGGTENSLLSMLQRFTTDYPTIQIKLHDGNHNDLLSALKYGTHDFTLTMGSTLAGHASLGHLPFSNLTTVLVVPKSHKLASKTSVCFQDFHDQPYLCVHKHITKAWYEYVISLYLSNGFFPLHSGTCDSVITLLMMVSLGKGITILTDGCRDAMPENLVAIPIENVPSTNMVIGYSHKNINPAVPLFIKWFHKSVS